MSICVNASMTSELVDRFFNDLLIVPVTSELADRRASMSSELGDRCVSMSSELVERCVSMTSELGDRCVSMSSELVDQLGGRRKQKNLKDASLCMLSGKLSVYLIIGKTNKAIKCPEPESNQ